MDDRGQALSPKREKCFYALPHTRRLLEDPARHKTILIGSFTGAWNFGDLLQLKGALRWHALHDQVGGAVCAVQGLATLLSPLHLDRLVQAFGAHNYLFYSAGQRGHPQHAQALGLERVACPIAGTLNLHVYGGGFFNQLWGQGAIDRIETLLAQTTPQHYVMSGQQIGTEFAPALATHCRRWHPVLIGCRDQQSLSLLEQQGLQADISGDDALEELALAAHDASLQRYEGRLQQGHDPALYLNTSGYVTTANGSADGVIQAINECIEMLAQYCGRAAIPWLLRAYSEERPGISDTLTTVARSRFAQFFPAFRSVDLVDLFSRGRLGDAAPVLRRCRLVVSTSYHVTLFMKMLGVPVYLFAFNDYYRQKKHGLGEPRQTLPEFLAADVESVIAHQHAYITEQQAVRARWLERMRLLLPVACPGAWQSLDCHAPGQATGRARRSSTDEGVRREVSLPSAPGMTNDGLVSGHGTGPEAHMRRIDHASDT